MLPAQGCWAASAGLCRDGRAAGCRRPARGGGDSARQPCVRASQPCLAGSHCFERAKGEGAGHSPRPEPRETGHTRARGLTCHRAGSAAAAAVQVEVQVAPARSRPELRVDARECGRVSGEPALRRARGRASSLRKVVRPWAQPRLEVSFPRAAARHAVPHQQWVPPIRRPAAPRWLRERAAASGVDEGGGGGGILASRPRWPEGSDERMGARTVVSTSRFSFSFPGAKRDLLATRTVVSTSQFEFSFPGAKIGLPGTRG